MVTCHYQDEPGCKGICLRTVSIDNGPMERLRWVTCDENRGSSCPHRGWDRQVRDEVVISRIGVLGRCSSCGSVHDTFREAMQCVVDMTFRAVSSPVPPPLPEGTKEPLVPPEYPRSIKERAWRRMRKLVMARDTGRCTECGRDLGRLPSWYGEVHHIIPRAFGGSDRPENLRTLCIECHGRYTDEMFRPGQVWPVNGKDRNGRGGVVLKNMVDDDE